MIRSASTKHSEDLSSPGVLAAVWGRVLGVNGRRHILIASDNTDAEVIMMNGRTDSRSRALWTANIADLGNHGYVEAWHRSRCSLGILRQTAL